MKKILLLMIIIGVVNVPLYGEGVNFINKGVFKTNKALYIFPFYPGPGVWDPYLRKNIGKISSLVVGRLLKNPDNKEFFSEFKFRVRNGGNYFWWLRKRGIDIFKYNFHKTLKVPQLIERKNVLYVFPKLKLFKFNRKMRIALIKVFFYVVDEDGNIVGRHRVKVVLKNGEFEDSFADALEDEFVEKVGIPIKYAVVVNLLDEAVKRFLSWVADNAVTN